MTKRKRFEKDKEPFIVCVDDLGGGFEIIAWFTTEDKAIKEYESWEEEYPDEEGRNKHIFRMIRTTGQDLGETPQ